MKKAAAALLSLLLLAGCRAVSAPDTAPSVPPSPSALLSLSPSPSPSAPSVYTDSSKLTPYEPLQPLYTLHAGYSGQGALEARDDYGALLPYIGKYFTLKMYVTDALPLYGLATNKGELVSDPVYAKINFYDDFLVLYRGDPEGIGGGDTYFPEPYSRTIAAVDGRWVHELTDSYFVSCGSGLLMTSAVDGSLDLWNTEGEIIKHFDSSLFTPAFGDDFIWNEAEIGPYIHWADNEVGYAVSYYVNGKEYREGIKLYLDFSSGAVTDIPPEGHGPEPDYSDIPDAIPEPPEIEGFTDFFSLTDKVSGETYFHGSYRSDEDGMVHQSLFDGSGNMLIENYDTTFDYVIDVIRAGLYSTAEEGCFCFRSLADGTTVFRYPMRGDID